MLGICREANMPLSLAYGPAELDVAGAARWEEGSPSQFLSFCLDAVGRQRIGESNKPRSLHPSSGRCHMSSSGVRCHCNRPQQMQGDAR